MPLNTNSSSIVYIDTYFKPSEVLDLYSNQLKGHSAIINAKSRQSLIPKHWGPTSLKFTLGGQEKYQVDNRMYSIDENRFLILNKGSEYQTEIDSDREVSIFTINLSEKILRSADIRKKEQSAIKMLDDPYILSNDPILFFERLYPFNQDWKNVVGYIKEIVEKRFNENALELDEALYLLCCKMSDTNAENYKNAEALLFKKSSTRIEIYKRLYYIKDFIECSYEKDITLSQLAAIGMLSEFYLIRQFKQFFGKSPFEYLTSVRIDKAKELILCSNDTIGTICQKVGYNDVATFSKLFKKHFHASPVQLRRQVSVYIPSSSLN